MARNDLKTTQGTRHALQSAILVVLGKLPMQLKVCLLGQTCIQSVVLACASALALATMSTNTTHALTGFSSRCLCYPVMHQTELASGFLIYCLLLMFVFKGLPTMGMTPLHMVQLIAT